MAAPTKRFCIILSFCLVGILLYYHYCFWFPIHPETGATIKGHGGGGGGLVPDLVHFFLYDTQTPLSFISATCILAVYLNHRPQQGIVLHTNTDPAKGQAVGPRRDYLAVVKAVLGSHLQVRVDPKSRPSHVYGQQLSSSFHATDVARINTLIKVARNFPPLNPRRQQNTSTILDLPSQKARL